MGREFLSFKGDCNGIETKLDTLLGSQLVGPLFKIMDTLRHVPLRIETVHNSHSDKSAYSYTCQQLGIVCLVKRPTLSQGQSHK